MKLIIPVATTEEFCVAVRTMYGRTRDAHKSLPGAIVAHWAWQSFWGHEPIYRLTHNFGGVPFERGSTIIGKSGPADAYGRIVKYRCPQEFVAGYLLYYGDMLNHDADGFFHAMADIDPGSGRRWLEVQKLWGTQIAPAEDADVRGRVLEGLDAVGRHGTDEVRHEGDSAEGVTRDARSVDNGGLH